MPLDSDDAARRRYAALWADYVRYGVRTDVTAPVAFVVDARTRVAAERIAAAVALGWSSISRKRWPFGRRWRLMAKTRPMALDRASVDAWFEELLALLRQHDADFVHWVPMTEPAD